MKMKFLIIVVLMMFSSTAASGDIDVKLMGRLINGMVKISERGGWYSCGKKLTEKEQHEQAARIVYKVLTRAPEYSPWGVIGVMFNESRFDECALGLGPRKWAYSENLMKRRKTHISHTFDEVLDFVTSRRARNKYSFSGFDLGLCQILTRFHPAKERELMTVAEGIDICIDEMSSRASANNTATPWLYWRGKATPWYRNKIRRYARRMGATRKEMKKI